MSEPNLSSVLGSVADLQAVSGRVLQSIGGLPLHLRTCCALLLLLVFACAPTEQIKNPQGTRDSRSAHLQRAARYPWLDEGRCVVQEASQPWHVLVERCYSALDTRRIRFNDVERRCPVATADAVSVETVVGICLLAQPELAVGAVIIIGTVVVAVAIQEELEAYERNSSRERARPRPQTRPAMEPLANRTPEPEGSRSGDIFPPLPTDSSPRSPACEPIPVPHAGEDDPHNECADKFPPNRYPGHDVLVRGKRFDALQVGVRVLWEIKTHQFDTYSLFLRNQVVRDQVVEMREERGIAAACGYDFVVGVSSAAHKEALLALEPSLHIVVTGCKR